MKTRNFQVALTDSEQAAFKKWCAAQSPPRSMGWQIALMIRKLKPAGKKGTP